MILKAYFVGWTVGNKFHWRRDGCERDYARALVRELRAAGYRDARMVCVEFSAKDFPKLRPARKTRATPGRVRSTQRSRLA